MSYVPPIKLYSTKRLAKLGCLACDTRLIAHCIVKKIDKDSWADTEDIKCPICGAIDTCSFFDWVDEQLASTTYKHSMLYPLAVVDPDFIDSPPSHSVDYDSSYEDGSAISTDEDETDDYEPQI